MANVLSVPLSGNIYFHCGSQSSTVPDLTGNAVSLGYDGSAGVKVTSFNAATSATDRFTVAGAGGSLFSVNDALTGTVFSVNDASGLPIIEVNSGAVTDTIAIGEYGTNALFVSAGNVGIGTVTPTSPLHVCGNIAVTGTVDGRDIVADGSKLDGICCGAGAGTVTSIATTGGITGGTITTSGTLGIDAACNTKWDQSGCAGINCTGNVTTNTAQTITGTKNFSGSICVGGNITHTGDSNTCIQFDTDAICLYTGGENHISINNTGVVINESSNNNYFRVEGGTDANLLYVDGPADNVGIGCSSPTQKLAVAGDGLFTSDLTVQGDLTVTGDFTCLETTVSLTSAMDITNTGTGPALIVNQTGSNDIVDFRDDGTSAFYIEDGGNVGIGCTNPTQKLDVAGNINTSGNIVTPSITLGANSTIKASQTTDDSLYLNSAGTGAVRVNYTDGLGGFEVYTGNNQTMQFTANSGGITIPGSIIHAGDADTNFGFSAANTWRVQTGGTERFKITGDVHVLGATDFVIPATRKLYLDGQSNTYLTESSADTIKIFTGGTEALKIDNSQNATFAGDVTVSGGDITLGGTGRIQGIDTVTLGTDAANKTYADTKLALAGGTLTGDIHFNDSVKANFGGSDSAWELEIYADSSNDAYIDKTATSVGDLIIQNQANDSDIIFRSDDGSGGVTPYLTLDGSITKTIFSKSTRHNDFVSAFFGSGDDLAIFHNGTKSAIENYVGNLEITQNTNDGDIIFQSDNGSGGVADYITIDGGSVLTRFKKNTVHEDNISARFGNSSDLQIYHDGADSWINQGSTGHLNIVNTVDDKDIYFRSDDGSGGTTAYFYLDGSETVTRFAKDIRFEDSIKANFGASSDLQIYHTGTDSVIKDTGPGGIKIDSNYVEIRNAAGTESQAKFIENGAVNLYYDNALKLQTTNVGVEVTGGINASGTLSASGTGFVDKFGIGAEPSGDEVLTVDGTTGNLFTITDSVTGTVFAVSDSAGLPILEAFTDSCDMITMGEYGSNALVVCDTKVGVGTATPNEALTVVGSVSATCFKRAGGTACQFLKADGSVDSAIYTTCTGTVCTLGNLGITSTAAEVNYTTDVTSNIQAQLNNKQASGTYNTIIGTDSDINTSGCTVIDQLNMTDGVIQSHSTRNITLGNLGITSTAAEVNYTTDVTSNIQAQLNGKLSTSGCAANSQLLDGLDSSAFLRSNAADTANCTITFCNGINFVNGNVWLSRDGNKMYIAAYDGWRFYDTQSGANRMCLTTGGNLGIGCTSPTQKLAVAGDGLFTSDLTVQGDLTVTGDFTCLETTVSLTSAMDITNTGTGPALIVNQTGANDIINFKDDGTSVFYIEDGGDVGIGTTDPTTKLQVQGDITLNSTNPAINFNGTSDASVDMQIYATPEGLDFREPEESNKIHFRILDDVGVDAPFGYKINGTSVIAADRTLANVTANASIITAGTLNADRLPRPISGDWWNGGAVIVGTDGVMEVGKYLDFHTSDTGTSDFDVRITAASNQISVGGVIQATGGCSTGWNTAYTYSQVGHLPLAGGTVTGDLTVGGGDITLGGTGRIQGIDTVSASTDAANKNYVDTCIAAVPTGDITAVVAGAGLTGGGTSGSVTVCHNDTSSQGSVNNNSGTVIQDVTLDTYGHVTALGSCNLDNRYYTESEINTYLNRGYSDQNVGESNLAVGWYTIATNTGDRAVARFGLRDTNSSDHQSVVFYAGHNYGMDASNTITVLHATHYSGNPFRYIRIKDHDTYDGAALQVYIDDASNIVDAFLLGDNFQSSGWVLKDWIPDATDPGDVSNYSSFTEKSKIDLDQIAQGGIATTGPIYADGDLTQTKLTSCTGTITCVAAGTGLTGGGASGCATVNVGAGTAITVAADTVGVTTACNTAWNNKTTCLGTTTSGNTQTFTNKSGCISQWTNNSGYTTCIGDITAVTAGSGLTGGATSGAATLNVGAGTAITVAADTVGVTTACNTAWNNKTTCTGTITCVAAGTGLTGGGSSGSATLNVIGGDGITANADNIVVDSTVVRTSGAQTIGGVKTFASDLTVQGDLTVTGDFTCLETTVSVTSAMDITNTGTGPALIVNQTGANDIINFKDDGTSVFYIEDGGDVGIGTSSPGAKLHVDDNTGTGTGILVTGGGAGGPLATFTRDVGATGSSVNIDANSNYPQLTFTTSSNSYSAGVGGNDFHITDDTGLTANHRLTILSTGNVGIGDTNPANKLDVTGNINTTGTYKIDDGDVINAGKCFVGAQVRPTTDIADAYIASAACWNACATSTQGTKADNALPKAGGAMTGAITTNSTFDGRNVSADGTKLDGIACGATSCTGDITAVTAGSGLTGGATSGAATLNVGAGTGITVAADTVSVTTACNTAWNNKTTCTGTITCVAAGTGLTGGGASGCATLNVIGGAGITANANDIAVDSTVVRTTGTQTIGGAKTFTGNVTIPNMTAPNAPASVTTAVVGETIDVTFAASTTSDIDAYLVYSSIDGSDYGLISIITPEDFSASMSVIDNAFTETGTQAYRVYAIKNGVLSSATTGSVAYTVSSAEPTTMSVVDLNNAFYTQWNPPSSNERFVTAYNVYKDENAVQGNLLRSNASLVYSGLNTNYMYQISGTNNNNFHQFWVETTIA